MSRAPDTVVMEGGPVIEHLDPLPRLRRRRSKVSPLVRDRVFDRDNHCCRDCGSERELTLDHIVPVSKGGSNHERNLRVLCWACNHERGNSGPAPRSRRRR